MEINQKMVSDGVKALESISKIVSTTSESREKKDKDTEKSTSGAYQVVQVQTNQPKSGKERPKVIHEKPEFHMYNAFPDGRALTLDECKLEEFRIKLEYEEKDKQRKHEIELMELRNKKEEENERRKEKSRTLGDVIMGVLGFFGLFGTGYLIHESIKAGKEQQKVEYVTYTQPVKAIEGEGSTVE